MAGFDVGAIFSSGIFNSNQSDDSSEFKVAYLKFKEFIKTFKYNGFIYIYLDVLKERCSIKNYSLPVEMKDLILFDENLSNKLIEKPNEYLPILEAVVNEIADEVTKPRFSDNLILPSIQILLRWDALPKSLREVKSDQISKLTKVSGIIISASGLKSKAYSITLQCKGCQQYLPNVTVKPGLNGLVLPRKCVSSATSARLGAGMATQSCPIDPYFIVPDKCKLLDYQLIKMQEAPENVPRGEIPRHMQLFVDRYLCDKAVPGNRVSVVGIPSIVQQDSSANKDGVQHSYLRVLSVDLENSGSTRSGISSFGISEEEEKEFKDFAAMPGIFNIISRSIAPAIFGSEDIKKAIACMLFGGSRKRMPDGLYRRGDINMLMLGDPGTAKSQLLKFVEQTAPIAVYTSGKGSSAAGLTASVMRDPATKNFIVEGGAMVLADGGVVCIDEFDKMREDDRVAIHEAMEQQTISISKAGITTMLNSRCSVLAAANSVFGQWDDSKGEENIDFMPTIMSRFDMIFIVKDVHDEEKDIRIAKHVMSVHIGEGQVEDIDDNIKMNTLTSEKGVIPMLKLKKYIAYCRERCGPRITEATMKKASDFYIMARSGSKQFEKDTGKNNSIPITIRQLEAILRIGESLAKMRLSSFVNESDIDEAIRLFQVSTMNAALSGNLDGVEGFTTQQEHDLIVKIEKLVKKRFVIGSQVSEQTITQDFSRQGFPERAITKVLHCMIRRGEIQTKFQKRLLMRVK